MQDRHAGSKRVNVRYRIAASLLGAIVLSGCSGVAERLRGGSAQATPAELDLIAQNLVYTLAQLDELNPLSTTVQISPPRSAFGREIARRVRDVGYGVQSVPDDRGGNYLRYTIQRTRSQFSDETRYRVSIGNRSVERAYERIGGRLQPASEQRVRGADATVAIELNDDLFALSAASPVSRVAFDADLEPQVVDVATGEAVDPDADAPVQLDSDPFRARIKQNLYGRIGSNYAQLFADYQDIDQHSLTFANDSMRLGAEQKAIIADYAARTNPQTDLVSVVGCSHGRTAIDNGNSVLAIGRANRVKEALVYAGLSPEIVLDEGCWAGDYHATFPKRGVVMTLKRRRS